MNEAIKVESAERLEGENGIVLLFHLNRSERSNTDKLLAKVRTWQNRAKERLANPPLELFIKEPKRSRNANSYMWVLLDKIAEITKSTRELVYREIVRNVGKWDDVKMKTEAVKTFVGAWCERGIGYQVEVSEQSTNYTIIRCYYGTSSYSKAEFSRLLEEVVIEAKGVGIDTRTPTEIAETIDLIYRNQKETL